MNEQLNVTISIRFDAKFRVINIDAISVCLDVILNVAIEKHELFNDIDSNIDANQNIDFNVVKKINETSETNEQINVDFFLTLHVDSDAKIRKTEFLTNFRA